MFVLFMSYCCFGGVYRFIDWFSFSFNMHLEAAIYGLFYWHFKFMPSDCVTRNRFGSYAMTAETLVMFGSILWLPNASTATPITHDRREAEQVAFMIESSISSRLIWCEGSCTQCRSLFWLQGLRISTPLRHNGIIWFFILIYHLYLYCLSLVWRWNTRSI